MTRISPSPALILLAADDADIVQTLQPCLAQEGYSVAIASTGAETLQRCEEAHPHLILLNDALPDGDGLHICAKLKAHPGVVRTPVIMIVRSDEEHQVAQRVFAAGAVDYFCKPASAVEANWSLLMRRIQYLIRAEQAEEALAQERNQWRTLIDNLPDDIYIKDTHSRFINVNTAVAHALGAATPDALIGKTDFDFHPQDLAARYFADEQALLATDQALVNHEEPVFDHATGKIVWYLTTKVPVKDRQGRIVGLVGMGRNITELKRSQDNLIQERTLLRTLIDNIPDYIYVKDLQSRYLINNVAHARLVGNTPPEIIGKTAYDIFSPELAERYFSDEQKI